MHVNGAIPVYYMGVSGNSKITNNENETSYVTQNEFRRNCQRVKCTDRTKTIEQITVIIRSSQ